MSGIYYANLYQGIIQIFNNNGTKNPYKKGYDSMQGLFGLSTSLSKSTIGKSLQDLIPFRVSQINGCAYCLDMHAKDLRAEGETEQRLYLLDAWRETSLYTERECAALA